MEGITWRRRAKNARRRLIHYHPCILWGVEKRVVSVNPVVNTANTQTQRKKRKKKEKKADMERRSKWKEPRKVGGGDETRQKRKKEK